MSTIKFLNTKEVEVGRGDSLWWRDIMLSGRSDEFEENLSGKTLCLGKSTHKYYQWDILKRYERRANRGAP